MAGQNPVAVGGWLQPPDGIIGSYGSKIAPTARLVPAGWFASTRLGGEGKRAARHSPTALWREVLVGTNIAFRMNKDAVLASDTSGTGKPVTIGARPRDRPQIRHW